MSKSKRTPHERSLELRSLLGCTPHQRTADAARLVLAERDQLRQRVKDLELALAVAWDQRDSGLGVLAEVDEDVQRQADADIQYDELNASREGEHEPAGAF